MICICLECKNIYDDLKNEMANCYLESVPCPNHNCQGTVVLINDTEYLKRILDANYD